MPVLVGRSRQIVLAKEKEILMRKIIFLLLLVVGFYSCASTSNSSTMNRRAHNYIFEEEIVQNSSTDAYDLISRLRPHWLRGRGQKSYLNSAVSYPIAYVNGSRLGPIEQLRNVSAENITMVQYLNMSDATIRFGMNHPSGAILVTVFR
jgi:hypothetical protein